MQAEIETTPQSVVETAREWIDATDYLEANPVIAEFDIQIADGREFVARMDPPRQEPPAEALTEDLIGYPYIRLKCTDGPMNGRSKRVCGLYVGATEVAFRKVAHYNSGPDDLPGGPDADRLVAELDAEVVKRC